MIELELLGGLTALVSECPGLVRLQWGRSGPSKFPNFPISWGYV